MTMTKQKDVHNGSTIDVDNLNWNDLRKTVKRYGLSSSGKKVDLQERLKNHYLQAAAEKEEVTKQVATGEAADVKEPKNDHVDVVDATTPNISEEQRRRMEENRKRALEIRQTKEQKRLKSSSEAVDSHSVAANSNQISPATAVKRNPYKNPYAKASTAATMSTPAAQPLSSHSSSDSVRYKTKYCTKEASIDPTCHQRMG